MYGCHSMLEWCDLFSGVKLSIRFNFRSIHLILFQVLLEGLCNE